MASIDAKPRLTAESPEFVQHKKSTLVSAKDRAFLKALHLFASPIIGVKAEAPKTKDDLDQITSGPEAAILVSELKAFILRIMTSPPEETKIDIRLDDENEDTTTEGDEKRKELETTEDKKVDEAGFKSDKGDTLETTATEGYKEGIENIENDKVDEDKEDADKLTTTVAEGDKQEEENISYEAHDTTNEYPPYEVLVQMIEDESRTACLEMLSKRLRIHVFNNMPIRLLSFTKNGSNLEVTLLERAAILAHLEYKLHKKFHAEYSSWAFESRIIRTLGLIEEEAGYAILSHTWLQLSPGEITYTDWINGHVNPNDLGYQKLVRFCQTAWTHHGTCLGWMDTLCINKDSSVELDESIRSMFGWYHRAKVCIVYLADTSTLHEMHLDPWFTRGWTLQELFAPKVVKFYNKYWRQFEENSENDTPHAAYVNGSWSGGTYIQRYSSEIMNKIKEATTITPEDFPSTHTHRKPSLSRIMQLAANRQVTRSEDTAYSLMGMFNVSISIAYGEGLGRAFSRLLQEILNSTKYGALDLLNWVSSAMSSTPQSSISQVLPGHPHAYLTRAPSISLDHIAPLEPLMLTNFGMRTPVLLMPGKSSQELFRPTGNFMATVKISGYYDTGYYGCSTVRSPVQMVDFFVMDKKLTNIHSLFSISNGKTGGSKFHGPVWR